VRGRNLSGRGAKSRPAKCTTQSTFRHGSIRVARSARSARLIETFACPLASNGSAVRCTSSLSRCGLARRWRARSDPMLPAAPVMRIRI
jgi:hypothetical protein